VIGVLSDRTRSRLGRRAPWILYAGLVGAVLLAAVRYAPSLTVLVVLWSATELALNVAGNPLQATVADRVPRDRRGRVTSWTSMGAIFAQPVAAAEVEATPAPRAALVAHGGGWPGELPAAATLCLGAERDGLPPAVLERCEERLTIPVRDGAESLNVAAAAAIACERISSRARASEVGDA